MDGNKSEDTIEPLFYIIQPVNKNKLNGQNMQEIYHSKGSIKDKTKLQEEYKSQDDEAVKNEDKEGLPIEERTAEKADITSGNHLIKETISQSEEDLNTDENKEVQIDSDIQKDDLRLKLIKLARYPSVVQKPFCEMKVKDELIIGQIESKRGDRLKIKVGGKIRLIEINDIEDLSIL